VSKHQQQADSEIHEDQFLNFLINRLDEEVSLNLANNTEIDAEDLYEVLENGEFDAVVLIGSKTYVGALRPHFEDLPAAVLTPWQTDESVTGVGRGMSWRNDESHWPETVDALEEIGEIVSAAPAGV